LPVPKTAAGTPAGTIPAVIFRSARIHLGCLIAITVVVWPLVPTPRHIMIIVHAILLWRVALLQFGCRGRDPLSQYRAFGRILDTAGLLITATILSTALMVTGL
jgi:hypothetical protein